MNCKICGEELPENSNICAFCGEIQDDEDIDFSEDEPILFI